MNWRLIQTGEAAPVAYAVEELTRCLRRMEPESLVDRICQTDAGPQAQGIRVGVGLLPLPFVEDPELDDVIRISVQDQTGIITGSNPRAVLLAVYRFLRELGCRFLRPGPEGELFPRLTQPVPAVELCEVPSYRHRGICIEGVNAAQNIEDLIDWMPKAGLNAYFTQFHSPYGFLKGWYAHKDNPFLTPEPFTPEDAQGIYRAYTSQLKKRGLLIHSVGHGWTCEPFGANLDHWERGVTQPEEGYRRRLALMDGERKLFGWTPETVWPGDTNLCYSQEDTRKKVVEAVADYCRSHPETDYLHLWLADGMNNHCECPDCAKMRPSDWYVTLLNEVDQKLCDEGLPHRIVFLIYVDLLWAPETVSLQHPERFVLMFAPITREFHRSFTPGAESTAPLLPYSRNRLEMPVHVEENAAMLHSWQTVFAGDSFDYDYHGVGAHHCDPGEIEIAHTMGKDMAALRSLGLNGMMSCQEQRLFFPSGLLMQTMAQTLWNREKPFTEICREHFQACYGGRWQEVLQYLQAISHLFDLGFIRREKKRVVRTERQEALRKVAPLAEAFLPVIEEECRQAESIPRRRSWELLRDHAALIRGEAEILLLALDGLSEEARRRAETLCLFLAAAEHRLQAVLDVSRLQVRIRKLPATLDGITVE